MDYRLVLLNLKFVDLQFLMTVDNDIKLSRDLGGFPEMNPGWKMFFDLPVLDIQREIKGYSICQI